MIGRCENPSNNEFFRYGGRGITIAQCWRQSFEAFLAEVGRKPSPQHSIDRIDNNRGYEPGNVRWATKVEQARNRRNSKYLTFQGRTQLQTDWIKELGISETTLIKRLRTMPAEEALNYQPARRHGRILWNGRVHTIRQLAAAVNIPYPTLQHRLRKGWPIEQAVHR